MAATGVHDRDAKWVRDLPVRWAVWALGLASAWTIASVVLQESLRDPAGGQLLGLVRLAIVILIPAVLMGATWGWSERQRLRSAIASAGADHVRAASGFVRVQTMKGAIAFVCFGIWIAILDRRDGLVLSADTEALTRLSTALATYAVLGAAFGTIVGAVTRRGLKRALGMA